MEIGRRRFATTRWSLVAAAARPETPRGAAALAALCEAYWHPVYAYVRRWGRNEDDARDLTQAFFARMIERNDVRHADPERGRFRTFLLASVRHCLANQHDAAVALKRGGGAVHVSIEPDDAERRYLREPVDRQTPEDVFQRQWALAVIDAALARLAGRYADGDRRRLFEHLRPSLAAGEPASYDSVAATLGMTPGALRVAQHRLRRAFRDVLREVVLDTVEKPEDVEDELRFLLKVVSS
jgi:RNA polymerase sigma factor (sigma-70 family)